MWHGEISKISGAASRVIGVVYWQNRAVLLVPSFLVFFGIVDKHAPRSVFFGIVDNHALLLTS
jgi:hypothetical protein